MNTQTLTQRSPSPTVEPPPLRPLALQIGELSNLCEKLLYRIQQLERREKEYRLSLQGLRRELRALRSDPSSPAPARARRKSPQPPTDPVTSGPPEVPDFSAAASELNG